MLNAVAETVRDAGRIPSGHVYAMLVGRISLDGYEKMLGILQRAGLIHRTTTHELVWIG